MVGGSHYFPSPNVFCCCQFQMFGLSKAVAEKNSSEVANGVESSLPLQTTLHD
jgi:hypothetical protein